MNIFKHVNRSIIEHNVMEAIKEDMAFSDITTQMCVEENKEGEAIIIAKEQGILSGVQIAEVVMQIFGTYVVDYKKEDGSSIKKDDKILKIKGKMRGILSGERIILNYMQRLSGIATYTNRFVKLVEGKNIKILDTRKTTPTLRYLEKYAVLCGGGTNHRMNLFDQIMIKDNHKDIMNNNLNIIKIMKNKYPNKIIVIEVDKIADIEEVLKYPVDRIMLDNMTPKQIEKAIKIINKRCEIEISGNINEDNILDYAVNGVDFISIGKITHSFKSIDLSMRINHD